MQSPAVCTSLHLNLNIRGAQKLPTFILRSKFKAIDFDALITQHIAKSSCVLINKRGKRLLLGTCIKIQVKFLLRVR